jgi:hypothetical protein
MSKTAQIVGVISKTLMQLLNEEQLAEFDRQIREVCDEE